MKIYIHLPAIWGFTRAPGLGPIATWHQVLILGYLQDLQVLDHFGPCVLTFLSKNGFQPFLAMLLRLTLDDFDNTEYDIRTPQQWIEMGHQVL